MINTRAKTNIPNIRIFVRFQTNICLSFDSIRVISFSLILEVSDPLEEVVKFSIKKLMYCELNYDYKLTILRLLRVTGDQF